MVTKVPHDYLLNAARTVWSDQKTISLVTADAVSILDRAHCRKATFYSGKAKRALVGGLFYLLSFRYNDPKRQVEIARKLGTSDITIRKSYRKWLTSFPDLFVDVIGQLSQHKSLKYFILVDFKPNASTDLLQPIAP